MRRIALAIMLAAAAAGADGAGVVAAEVGCGYAGGLALGLAGVPLGNLLSSEDYAGGGMWGLIIAYPAGAGLGTYGAGEFWGEDAANDWVAAGAALGASYAAPALGFLFGRYRGLIVGLVVAPLASTAAYNLVKETDGEAQERYLHVGFTASF